MTSIIIFSAKDLVYFVILAAGVAWLIEKKHKIRMLVTILVACALAYITVKISSHLYYDPRPFVVDHIKPLIPHSADNGFPSDHALFTAMLTAIVFFYSRKIAWGMVVGSLLVGIGRIMAHIHSPFQIGAGWVLGIVCALAAYFLVRYVLDVYAKKSQATLAAASPEMHK